VDQSLPGRADSSSSHVRGSPIATGFALQKNFAMCHEADIDASLLRGVEPFQMVQFGLPRDTLLDSFRSIVRSSLCLI
jgi:hypothetical protein